MVYQGSKAQIAQWLVPILQSIIDENDITFYWEPFVGGANVIDKIKCENRLGSDKSISLIALLEKARDNIEELPEDCSREDFVKAKDIYREKSQEQMELWKIEAYQYLASFGARGFAGGYAPDKNGRHYYTERLNNLKKQAPFLQGVKFKACDYRDFMPPLQSLIYCDIPYFGTKEYGYADEAKFDYNTYWNWIREQSKNNYVICSEENFPDDFIILKTTSKTRTLKTNNDKIGKEKLGIWKNGLIQI